MPSADTIAAIATAPGRGGIGVVRVSGPGVRRIIEGVVAKPLPARVAVLSTFTGHGGEALDNGLALYFPAPNSYTGEDTLELQGHGGPVVLRRLVGRCVELGARLAEPGEFTKRAFLNGKLDLAQAEAVADLIDAATTQAARSALRSLSGEFSRRVDEVARALKELRALVEATLDFPDEEVDVLEAAGARERVSELRIKVEEVLAAAGRGRLLRDGVRVVIAGRPNAGKSSLINRLAGDSVAIVADTPGTTRDLVRESIELNGVPVHLTDTAGIRESGDAIEQQGVARARAAITEADCVLLVVDASDPQAEPQLEELGVGRGVPVIRVMNKVDLLGMPAGRSAANGHRVFLSALTGDGVDLLRSALMGIVGWGATEEGEFIARDRHVLELREVVNRLQAALANWQSIDLVAEELRLAHVHLGRLIGEFTSDDLLGEIFARFCIGK